LDIFFVVFLQQLRTPCLLTCFYCTVI
jgi:hypothetical protein